ncbi:STAS domain-containing protein [Mucilaginibacter daejeonensis]|uniref:STAS domain-containing protein n=1 Tax=Mucilaginibacter daejeonensis TaxID=398049 RepID=UPI001D175B25|nr:STAS domain-containing protein [Mucilaginibacter daejeonensis]UEG53837.1 STAS domain-containing protein [Mucilaginibacter daejeonensis]
MISLIKEEPTHLIVQVDLTEANLSHADQVKEDLISFLEAKGRSLWVDMHKVSYVDSSFLGALVAALKHAISMKADVVLLGLQKDIEDLLKLIRLDRVFKIYSSEEEARKAAQI